MKKYRIEVTEMLSRVVETEAESELEALKMTMTKYQSCDFVLDASDYMKTEFCVIDEKTEQDRPFSRINC